MLIVIDGLTYINSVCTAVYPSEYLLILHILQYIVQYYYIEKNFFDTTVILHFLLIRY